VSNVEQDIPLLDETIAGLSSDLRQDLATAAGNDLYLFCTAVLRYRDLTPHTHGALCTFLDRNPARFKHIELPRDHLKTTICTIGRNMQKVVKNPNKRILIINETSTNAERFMGAIKQHAESNKIFRALYSHIIPKNFRGGGWSNQELKFERIWIGPEPTIDTMGMTGAVTSRHFTDITIDDPISEEAVKSELVMADAINRIQKVLTLMVNPNEDVFDLVGTRWAFADIYRHFMRLYKGKMALFIRGAIEDDLPIWPERFSLETLAQQRKDMGEYMFSCLMMNNPRNTNVQDINVQDLRFWRWADDYTKVVLVGPDGEDYKVHTVESLDICVAVDPASAEKLKDDRNAIVTVGTTKDGDVIVLDVWAKRCSPIDVIEYLFTLRQRYRPRVFGIEDVSYQKVLKHFLRAEANRRGEYFNVQPLKPGGRHKQHIRGLQPVAATGHLYISPIQHTLRNELADYPLGEHDDTADALALSMQMWRGVTSPSRWLKYKESEKQLLRLQIEQARNAGIGHPDNFARILQQAIGYQRPGDPRYAIHPDELPEEGWHDNFVLSDVPRGAHAGIR